MRRVPPRGMRGAAGGGWHREIPARVRRYFDERRLLKYVLVTIVSCFVAGYLVMALLFFPGFGRSAIVTVPDLTGRPLGQAERQLSRAGLTVLRGGSLANPRVGRNRVLMQSPLPGEEVARGTQVRIVLSAGPEMRVIPPIEGLSQPEVVGLLQRFGFRTVVRSVRDRADEGTLLGLRPASGRQAAVSSTVELLVSAGPPNVLVPQVTGLLEADARARLQAAALGLGRISYDPASAEPAGTVLGQSPAAGDSLPMGRGVRVTLAGADPNPAEPEPDSLAVDSAVAAPAEDGAGEETAPAPAPPPARD